MSGSENWDVVETQTDTAAGNVQSGVPRVCSRQFCTEQTVFIPI